MSPRAPSAGGGAPPPGAKAVRAWARELVSAATADDRVAPDPIDVVAAVVVAVARSLPADSIDLDRLVDPSTMARADAIVGPLPEPPGGWADPWLPGIVHEQAISGPRRSARGAWYTPESVVRGLVALATTDDRPPSSVIDPTCGGGAFLLAALDRYRQLGVEADDALTRVGGTDIDGDAVRTSRWSLQLWAAANGVELDPDAVGLRVADVLAPGSDAPTPLDGQSGHDGALIIGNPPFATPLRSGRLPESAEAFREANRDLLGPYSDLAARHLLAALRSAAPGSTVALILPQSVLASRDTEALRQHCDRVAPLLALWATRDAVFDAGVRACAVVLGPGQPPTTEVTLAAGAEVELVARTDRHEAEPGHWAGHAARALGAPALPATVASNRGSSSGAVSSGGAGAGLGALAEMATATAGFRDEYYGLVAACREWDGADGGEPNRLVTVGSIDPLDLAWGRRTCRLGGRQWHRPVVDLDALDDRVGGWVSQRSVPKVVLATQSRVLEPVVDRSGHLVPVTPLITVEAPADSLDRIAAVLLAPPVVAWAWQRWFGASLSVDALKLAAKQVLELPLPADEVAWADAAALIAEADAGAGSAGAGSAAGAASVARAVAELMNRAYGAEDSVYDWWRARADRRGTRGATGPAGSSTGRSG